MRRTIEALMVGDVMVHVDPRTVDIREVRRVRLIWDDLETGRPVPGSVVDPEVEIEELGPYELTSEQPQVCQSCGRALADIEVCCTGASYEDGTHDDATCRACCVCNPIISDEELMANMLPDDPRLWGGECEHESETTGDGHGVCCRYCGETLA